MVKRDAILAELRGVVGVEGVLADEAELIAYECDGLPLAKAVPTAVVFPTSTEQVAGCVKVLNGYGVQIVPRGTGTGLAGGSTAYDDGVVICTSRMRRIFEVDLAGRTACVEAGVRNLELTDHVNRMPGGEQLHFAPDPSSQRASTIGGNAATNAGGLHTLKYGVTSQHLLGLEVVLADGSVMETQTGGLHDRMGPDLTGLVCGCEGTMGIITKVWVRLTPKPYAFRTIVSIFDSTRQACRTVADVIASGTLPATMEIMDGAMVQVVENAYHFGFPLDAQALVLIEVDGVEAVLDEQMEQIVAVCKGTGAREVECSADAARREQLWSARKRAFGAVGQISPSYCTQDACVPRSTLPDVLDKVAEVGKKYDIRITNVFHAGDGNVHPLLLFDERDREQCRLVLEASFEILRYCMSIGGTLTGEHGVGVEKLELMSDMFNEPTLRTFDRIKRAFDPNEQINAGKLLRSEKVKVNLLAPAAANTPGGAL